MSDLVQVSNEQVRYILDNVQDFVDLPDDEREPYVPERDKTDFEDWNPVNAEGLTPQMVVLDALIRRLAESDVPSVGNAPANIDPAASGIWRKLMRDTGFSRGLGGRSATQQWAIAEYVFTLRVLKHGRRPYVGWTQANTDAFASRVKSIRDRQKQACRQ